MTPVEFDNAFHQICDWYRRTPNDLVIDVYWEALRHLSLEQFIAATKTAIRTEAYMPTPDAILALIAPSNEEKAIEQWTMIHALACRGGNDITGLDDEAISALEKLTGKSPSAALRALGQFDSFQTAKWESQFKRLYTAATHRAPMDAIAPAPEQQQIERAA